MQRLPLFLLLALFRRSVYSKAITVTLVLFLSFFLPLTEVTTLLQTKSEYGRGMRTNLVAASPGVFPGTPTTKTAQGELQNDTERARRGREDLRGGGWWCELAEDRTRRAQRLAADIEHPATQPPSHTVTYRTDP